MLYLGVPVSLYLIFTIDFLQEKAVEATKQKEVNRKKPKPEGQEGMPQDRQCPPDKSRGDRTPECHGEQQRNCTSYSEYSLVYSRISRQVSLPGHLARSVASTSIYSYNNSDVFLFLGLRFSSPFFFFNSVASTVCFNRKN
jgi:hypothetical protein